MGVAITGLLRTICCKIYLSRKSRRNVSKCAIRKEQHNWKTQHLNKDLIIFELFFVIRLKTFSVFGLFPFDAENINKLSNIIIERTPGYYMFEAGTIYSFTCKLVQ